MLIYSKTINLFIKKYTKEALLILKNEVGLETKNKRFLYNKYSYPLEIVVFEDDQKWGYFESSFFKIGLNKKLLLEVNHQLILNILKHELAHYLCFLKFRDTVAAHGMQYRQLCTNLGWDKNVFSASLDLSKLETIQDIPTIKIKNKIKKLMALQSSSNQFESELATAKVNELLIKYNLESCDYDLEDDEEVFVKRILGAKRRSTKLESIANILNEFYVHSVFSSGTKEIYLEVVGTKLNVETADYVGKFLFNEFESLYKIAQKTSSSLKGVTAKNNFFYGLAEGYIAKIKNSKKTISSKDLVLVNEKLERNIQLAYPNLRGSRKKMNIDADAINLGKKMGRGLNIRPGLTANLKKLFLT